MKDAEPMAGCDEPAAADHGPHDTPPCHAARDLTAGGDLATITHLGQRYTLRITRQGKLILTK